MRLLLVEDAIRLRQTVARALTRLGHAVDETGSAEEAAQLLAMTPYDAVVLDIMLPGESGLELLKKWRAERQEVPVLLLTALASVDDRVKGLVSGADDYLVKPFAIVELAARLEALVRRRHGQPDSMIAVGPLEIDLAARTVKRLGKAVTLTAREFSLLECLARRPGQILNREQIEAQLYSETDSPLSNAVDAAVYGLRRKLSPPGTPSLIQTRRGLGYVLEAGS